MPQMMPMKMEPTGETSKQPAVTPTSPASTPFMAMEGSGLPVMNQMVSMAAAKPVQAERQVFTAM